MTTKSSYQLTTYPVGSLSEVWSVSWPLMLGLCSSSLMMFADRLFLARYSVAAMNAMGVGGLLSFLILIIPFSICQITEVFVGRCHGEEKHSQAGRPIWQAFWISLILWPIMALVSRGLSWILFGANALEPVYFVTLIDFSPFFMGSLSLMGFFIGIGKTKIITYATILANFVNILLAPLFIFGASFIPAMGVKGAAVATGLSQAFQMGFLLILFLAPHFRKTFYTQRWTWDFSISKEMLQVALPSGFGRMVEVVAHLVFYQIIARAGPDELTCSIMIQSFFLLALFCIDGLVKGVTTIISNLVGAKEYKQIPQVIWASFKVHALVTATIAILCLTSSQWIFSHILDNSEKTLFDNPSFLWKLHIGLIWMCLFYLIDGFSWIITGYLTAIGDTKFIMFVSAAGQWITYILPVYLLVTYANAGAPTGWMILTINALIILTLFWRRSQTKLGQELLT